MKVHHVLIPLTLLAFGGLTLWWQKQAPGSGPVPVIKLIGSGVKEVVPRAGPLQVTARVSVEDGAGLRAIEFLLDGHVVQTVNFEAPYPADYVATYTWEVRGAGPHTWQARTITDKGRRAESAVKAIAVLANDPPILEIQSPAEGQVFPSDHNPIGIVARAQDSDDGVDHIEFFLQNEKVATLPGPFAQHTFARLHAGAYELRVRATDRRGATSELSRKFQVRPAVPYATTFAPDEGFAPGSLQPESGWGVTSYSEQEVVAGLGIDGGAALRLLPPGESRPVQVSLPLDLERLGRPRVVFHDVWLKPVADENILAASQLIVGRAGIALWRHGAEAEVQSNRNFIDHGRPIWRHTRVNVPVNGDGQTLDWIRLTVRSDLEVMKWDLYVNGRMVLHDLPQDKPIFLLNGHHKFPVLIGRVAVQGANPLFADADGDGIADDWEAKNNLLGGRTRRINDTDGDGLTDIDEYVWHTDPRNRDTDGDGATDGYEVRYGLDPLKPLTSAELDSDEDHDGISLAREIAAQTPPVPPQPGEDWNE